MSETSLCRDRLAPYCIGWGLDIGFGGDPITPFAIPMDLPTPYTRVGEMRQILQGHAHQLPFICDGALDYIFSSHLLEDFSYDTLRLGVIREWRSKLRDWGNLVIYCPDQARYVAHCEAHGQPVNPHHVEADFSLATFITRVLNPSGAWEVIHMNAEVDAYSWELVARKLP